MRKMVNKPLTEVFADPELFEQFIQSFPVHTMLGPELQKLQEATVLDKNFEMSPEEIEYIFKYIDQNNAGRNMAGKTVDKANQIRGTLRSIDKKILSLLSTKTAIQVEGFDQFMDQAEAKLKETDPEGKTVGWLQQYRAFAQKHPLSQAAITVIIAIVMALATGGIAWWAPAVGAFLLKGMFARLEGLNWKQSAYKGAKAATAAALLSWALQPGGGADVPGAADVADAGAAADAGAVATDAGTSASDSGASAADAASYTVAAGDTLSQIAQQFGTSVELIVQNNPALQGINPDQISPGMVFKIPAELADVYANSVGTAADTVQKLQDGSLAVRWGNVPDAIQDAVAYGLKAKGVGESVEHLLPSLVLASNYGKTKFTESQVNQIFAEIDRMMITEAPAGYRVVPVDSVDRKFTDRAGRFITAKNTLGKLKSSWEVDDSESTAQAIQNFLQRRGVSDEIIIRAFNAVYQKGGDDQEGQDQDDQSPTPEPKPEPEPDPKPEPEPEPEPEPDPDDQEDSNRGGGGGRGGDGGNASIGDIQQAITIVNPNVDAERIAELIGDALSKLNINNNVVVNAINNADSTAIADADTKELLRELVKFIKKYKEEEGQDAEDSDEQPQQDAKKKLEQRLNERLCALSQTAIQINMRPKWPEFKKLLVDLVTGKNSQDQISTSGKLGFTPEEVEAFGGKQAIADYFERQASKYRGKWDYIQEDSESRNYAKKIHRAMCSVAVTAIYNSDKYQDASREKLIKAMAIRARQRNPNTAHKQGAADIDLPANVSTPAITGAVEQRLASLERTYGKYLK